MKAIEWVDKAKALKGWDSDYRAAKELGITLNAISNYRAGLRQTLDEGTAMKVAQVLGVHPAGIIVDQLAERSKNDAVRTALRAAVDRLCILCLVPKGSGLLSFA